MWVAEGLAAPRPCPCPRPCQETYGESPWLAGRMGVAATNALQARSAGDFLLVSSVTRHFLGYHGATDIFPQVRRAVAAGAATAAGRPAPSA